MGGWASADIMGMVGGWESDDITGMGVWVGGLVLI